VEKEKPFSEAQRDTVDGNFHSTFNSMQITRIIINGEVISIKAVEMKGPNALKIPLIATANNVTLRTDPCGTPFSWK
jgi:hypothetical protein